jgi:uncharacterized membrane protein
MGSSVRIDSPERIRTERGADDPWGPEAQIATSPNLGIIVVSADRWASWSVRGAWPRASSLWRSHSSTKERTVAAEPVATRLSSSFLCHALRATQAAVWFLASTVLVRCLG